MKQPPHILILEDERTIRDSLKAFLEDSGFKVSCVKDGSQGLDILQTQHFDLVSVDLIMPGMSGGEFIRKTQEMGKDLNMIVLTGCDKNHLPEELDDISFPKSDIYHKPIDLRVLEQVIHEKLKDVS